MAERKSSYTQAEWSIMDCLMERENFEEGLAESLEVAVHELKCEAGAIWILDKKTDRLLLTAEFGSVDLSGISIENGMGIEGVVVKTGKPVMTIDAGTDPDFAGTIFDDHGLPVKTMVCVPLFDLHETIGCVQVVNKTDGSSFTEEELQFCIRMAELAAITIVKKNFYVSLEEDKKVMISLRNAVKDFPSGEGVLHVLRGINLDIYEDEFVVILGESGCGKSTMMNIMGGMDFLTDGQLLVEGRDFSRPADAELTNYRRNDVGFVFQAYNLLPNLTALENVMVSSELAKNPMSPEKALEKVGLFERAGNYPSQLSGGEQQRVSIARAIVKNPKILFADEPTAALDFQTGQEILAVLEDITKTQATTVVMITHNAEIAKMADRVVKLRGGKIVSIRRNQHPLSAREVVW